MNLKRNLKYIIKYEVGYAFLNLLLIFFAYNLINTFSNKILLIFTVIFVILYLLISSIFSFHTLSLILTNQNEKLTISKIIPISFENTYKSLTKFYLIVPLTFTYLFFNYFFIFFIISFLTRPAMSLFYLKNNLLLFLGIFLLLIIFIGFLEKYIYLFNSNYIPNKEKRNIKIEFKMLLKTYFKILVSFLIMAFVFMLMFFFGVIIISLISKLIIKTEYLNNYSTSIMWLLIIIIFIILSSVLPAVNYLIVNRNFNLTTKFIEMTSRKHIYLLYTIVLIIIILSTILFANNSFQLPSNLERKVYVTSHRGSNEYPANTIPAFDYAQKLGADWIELDVRQTKDQKNIVFHDETLEKFANIKEYIWNIPYTTIEELNLSSPKISLLDEVVKYAQEHNMKINIELKPGGQEVDFERTVIDTILKYDYAQNIVISSYFPETLKNVKAIAPFIKTIYVINTETTYNILKNASFADGFSIKYPYVSLELVNYVHNLKKEIHVWTLNNSLNIYQMLNYRVDNIITDDITLVKQTIANYQLNPFFEKIWYILN